jgi:GxxExxY protein
MNILRFGRIYRGEHESAEVTQSMERHALNELGGVILDACIMVHRELGPGLLESAYTAALLKELKLRSINVRSQVVIEMEYRGEPLGKVYVMDVLVENEIILEIKAVDKLDPIFTAQLVTYLKLANKRLGYLINFNVQLLKDGFHRIVYKF